jgi:hypothetical protein
VWLLLRTDVSEELSASFIRVTRIGELGTTLAVTSNWRTLRRNTWYIPEDAILQDIPSCFFRNFKNWFNKWNLNCFYCLLMGNITEYGGLSEFSHLSISCTGCLLPGAVPCALFAISLYWRGEYSCNALNFRATQKQKVTVASTQDKKTLPNVKRHLIINIALLNIIHPHVFYLNTTLQDCKIWGFHGGDYEEWCLLGCYAVWLL